MSVNIITPVPALQWNGTRTLRAATNKIIIHHAAANTASVYDIHNAHINRGWIGIGYNFYIRKDGTIYEGRGWNYVGTHTENYNSDSIGICCEGYYHNDEYGYTDSPTRVQLRSLIELIAEVKTRYNITSIGGHNDFNQTACPGNLFPKSMVITASAKYPSIANACNTLVHKGVISSPDYWSGYFWCLEYLDSLILSCADKCKNYQTGNYTLVPQAVNKLVSAGIITSPTYWLNNYSSVQYLGEFLKQAANHA